MLCRHFRLYIYRYSERVRSYIDNWFANFFLASNRLLCWKKSPCKKQIGWKQRVWDCNNIFPKGVLWSSIKRFKRIEYHIHYIIVETKQIHKTTKATLYQIMQRYAARVPMSNAQHTILRTVLRLQFSASGSKMNELSFVKAISKINIYVIMAMIANHCNHTVLPDPSWYDANANNIKKTSNITWIFWRKFMVVV